MATIDMTQRKLNFPPRFLPYLEKHRIFELFHECVELLVQVKPRDHVQFLKNILPCASMKKDKQRIVFLSPPPFDRRTFAELLADCLGIQCLNLAFMLELTKERLKAELPSYVSETLEEESCICPGEGEIPGLQLYYPPSLGEGFYIHPSEEQEFVVEEEEKEEEEEEVEVEVEVEEEKEVCPEEKPCICVCPCAAKAEEKQEENPEKEEEEEVDDDRVEEKEKGEEEEEEEEEKEEEEEEDEKVKEGEVDEPCPERRKRKHKKICPPKPCQSYNRTFGMLVPEESIESIESVEIMFGLLAECEQSARGWILEDFPKTGEEAEKLNSLGVIPTHALRIIVDEKAEENDLEYKEVVQKWTKAYKYVPVLEIRKNNRNMDKLVRDMCNLLWMMPHRHAPMLPRIVLIGSRGAGVTTQGQKLAEKYGLVHVEYDLVISRALQQDDELCKMYKVQLATRPDPELEAFILERALLTSKCRNRGWVLTGYPTNIDQMRMLDIIATPPNRVIFIEVPPRECFVRLYYRKTDPCLGDEYKLPETEPAGMDLCETPGLDPEVAGRLLSHPRNDRKQVVHDIEEYFLKKPEMMAYCGKTAAYVDGNQEVERVSELIEQVIINPSPPVPPRDPLTLNYGIQESYDRLKKFRLHSGMFYNNMLLNPPERMAKT